MSTLHLLIPSMLRTRRFSRIVLLVAVLMVIGGSSASALPVYARAFVQAGSDSTSQPQVTSDGTPVSNSAALSTLNGFGSASAHGAPGYAGVSALVESDRNFTDARAGSSLSWDDGWSIMPENTSLIGRTALVRPILSMTGGGTAQSVTGATSSADWYFVAAANTRTFTIAGGSWRDVEGAGVGYTGDPLGQMLTGGPITLQLGTSTPVTFELGTNIRLDCFFSCVGVRSASVDLSNTLHWMGLSVTDENGDPIGNFSLTATSGVDYTQPIPAVPEPGTALLTGSGLVILSLTRRRGRLTRPE